MQTRALTVSLLLIITMLCSIQTIAEGQSSYALPQVLTGQALRWQNISNCPESFGYTVLVLVADWDNDGGDELLIPAAAVYARKNEPLKDRSYVMELDGTVRPVPLNGLCLFGTAVVWDYNRDGFPEIAVDSGGWANFTLASRTREHKTFTDPDRLDDFNRTEEERKALTSELQSLDPQAADFFERSAQLLSRLSAQEIIYSGLEWKAHDDFGGYDKAMDALHRGLEPGHTVILNLAGKLQAKLKGNLVGPGSLPVGNYYGETGDDLVLAEFFPTDRETFISPPAKLLCYSKGAKLVKRHTCLNPFQAGAAGDIDHDGKLELLETEYGDDGRVVKFADLGTKLRALKPKALGDLNVTEAFLCFDLNHDGWAETLVAPNIAWDNRNNEVITLETPPGFNSGGSFASNNANVCYFALSETSPLLTWVSTTHRLESSGIAAYGETGRLVYFEELGEPVLWITTANGEDGKPYLVVQTESRILVWPQGGKRGTPLMAGVTLRL